MSEDLDPIASESLGEITRIGAQFLAALVIVMVLALPAILT